jgi:excisionase family DNA binding protein
VQTEVAAQVAAALAERPAVAELLTVKQAAAVAQVAPATIRRWIRTGYLNAHHAGRAVRIKRVDLERFLSSNHRVAGNLTPEQCAARDFG